MSVDTKRTADRRRVSLGSLDDLRGEARRVVAAEREGRLRRSGNWTLGQTLGHLAFWLNSVFDGPPGPKPPLFVRILGPILLKRMFLKGLPPGFRMPKVEAGTYGLDLMTADEGERRLLASIDRLERGTPPERHVILGRLTKEQWIQMHLRHAELHLSFLHPE
jgi:Protein of unknown function (DUF1569)